MNPRGRGCGGLELVSALKASSLDQPWVLVLVMGAGTRPEKIRIQKWYTVYKDHITLEDYEIRDGMGLEMVSSRVVKGARRRG